MDILDPDLLSNSSGSRTCSQSSTGDENDSVSDVTSNDVINENELLEFTEDEILFGNLEADGTLEDLVFS